MPSVCGFPLASLRKNIADYCSRMDQEQGAQWAAGIFLGGVLLSEKLKASWTAVRQEKWLSIIHVVDIEFLAGAEENRTKSVAIYVNFVSLMSS